MIKKSKEVIITLKAELPDADVYFSRFKTSVPTMREVMSDNDAAITLVKKQLFDAFVEVSTRYKLANPK